MEEVVTRGPEETRRLAGDLLKTLGPGAVLALHGELGAGKTCFVQGLARALGVSRAVTSPTFTLINEYAGTTRLYHVDLYRVANAAEALALGLDEYVHGEGITAIEWAERVQELLPSSTVHIYMEAGEKPDERVLRIRKGAA